MADRLSRKSLLYIGIVVLAGSLAGVLTWGILTSSGYDQQAAHDDAARARSVHVQGVLTRSGTFGHGTAYYSFTYNGKEYNASGQYEVPNPKVDPRAGQAVYLSVDPINPIDSCVCDVRRLPPSTNKLSLVYYFAFLGCLIALVNLGIYRYQKRPKPEKWVFDQPTWV